MTLQGGVEEPRSCTWWGGQTGVCAWTHGGVVGPACVTGGFGSAGHRRGPYHIPIGREVGPIQSADRPGKPLWGEDRGRGEGGGCGRHTARVPGQTPLPMARRESGRDANSRDQGALRRSWIPQLEGTWPLSCREYTLKGRPKISRSGAAREYSVRISGRSGSVDGEAFPLLFSQPPCYLFKLFDLEGYICLAHFRRLLWPPEFGLESGLLTAGMPFLSPLNETNCALDYDSPFGFAVIVCSR